MPILNILASSVASPMPVLKTLHSAIFISILKADTAEDGKRTPPEQEKVYPEPWMFGTIPASGFYVRHARNITFNNVNFHFATPDGRPLYVTDDAEIIKK